MVIDNEKNPPDDENVIEMPGLKKMMDEHEARKQARKDGKGLKEFKTPSKKTLEAMVENYINENQQLTDFLFRAGLIHCAVHNAAKKIFDDMGGEKIISPGMGRHKQHIAEIVEATKTYKDWDKINVGEPEGKGPDSDESGSSPSSIS